MKYELVKYRGNLLSTPYLPGTMYGHPADLITQKRQNYGQIQANTAVTQLFKGRGFKMHILGASEIAANLYCNCVYLYGEGRVICSIYLR